MDLQKTRDLMEKKDLSALAAVRDQAIHHDINDRDPCKSHYIKTQDDDYYYYGNFRVEERLYLRKTRKPSSFKTLWSNGGGDSSIIKPDELMREDYPVQVSIPAHLIRKFSQIPPTLPPPKSLIPTRHTYNPRQSLRLLDHCHQGYWPFLEQGFYERGKYCIGSTHCVINKYIKCSYCSKSPHSLPLQE